MRGRADDAFEHGNYLAAADLYDRIVAADPNDADAKALRTSARSAALRQMLADEQSARRAGHTEDANARLAQLLDKRDLWKQNVDATIAAPFAAEIAAAGASVRDAVAQQIGAEGPLRAEVVARHYEALLSHAELRLVRDDVAAAVTAAGRAQCDRLANDATPTSPYWSWLVDRYCAHWGGHLKFDPELPHLRASLAVGGDVAGATPAEIARMHASLGDAFKRTLWYGANAPQAARATLEGVVTVAFTERTVSFDRPWTEEIPYVDTETYQEPYQEPYSDTETYTDQVPYTDYETYTYPCGSSTCTGTRAVTKYRSEMRTRTVTRWRTAYRTATRQVTRYRYEPRTFHFDATEHTGTYESALVVLIDRGTEPPFVVKLDGAATRKGLFHDVSFGPAGVAPERPNLPTREAFVAQEESRLDRQLVAALDARYRELYCAAARYSLDAASACAYAGGKAAPAGVHAALRERFGDDEELVMALLPR